MKLRNVFDGDGKSGFRGMHRRFGFGTGQSGSQWRPAPPAPAAPRSKLRHLLYIATPGDNGADDQSGVIVLDADHDYRFRETHSLTAWQPAKWPGPQNLGHDRQHSGKQDLRHHRRRQSYRL